MSCWPLVQFTCKPKGQHTTVTLRYTAVVTRCLSVNILLLSMFALYIIDTNPHFMFTVYECDLTWSLSATARCGSYGWKRSTHGMPRFRLLNISSSSRLFSENISFNATIGILYQIIQLTVYKSYKTWNI